MTPPGCIDFVRWVAIVAMMGLIPSAAPVVQAAEQHPDESPAPSSPSLSNEPSPAPKEYADGVRIDWRQRRIELDARVVLREGPLELLACSPMTREHESILTVRARPRDVFHALGLLGIEPGAPPTYDPKAERSVPARGASLDIRLRCDAPGHDAFVPAQTWLRDNQSGKAIETLPWVFAGSRSTESGRFLADLEGTVICVVDFDTALICPGTSHTSDNNALWLSANSDAIPPVGTSCVISIQSSGQVHTIELRLDDQGRATLDDHRVELDELVAIIVRKREPGQNIRVAIVLPPIAAASKVATPSARAEEIAAALVRNGLRREWIEIRTSPKE